MQITQKLSELSFQSELASLLRYTLLTPTSGKKGVVAGSSSHVAVAFSLVGREDRDCVKRALPSPPFPSPTSRDLVEKAKNDLVNR